MNDLLLRLQEERFLLLTPSTVVPRLPPVLKLSVVRKPNPVDQLTLHGNLDTVGGTSLQEHHEQRHVEGEKHFWDHPHQF